MAKKYKYSNISALFMKILDLITPQLRGKIIKAVKELRDYAKTTDNPLDDLIIQLLIDILNIDPDEVIVP